jgi:high-affinity iron transporter
MIAAYVLALREGMEAALIVGVAFGALRQLRRPDGARPVWLGILLAAAISLAAGVTLTLVGAELEGAAEQAFEGITMLLAAGVLTWMVFWMQSQGRQIQTNLKVDVSRAATSGQHRALFWLAFLAVLREGIETALFLAAAALASGITGTVVGGVMGLATAAALGWALYAATVRLDVRRFFTVTGALVLLFAAGLVAHGVHEFNELGWIPGVVEHIWDTTGILDETSVLGQAMRALFGYNADPSLSEALSYVAYLTIVGFALSRRRTMVAARQQA